MFALALCGSTSLASGPSFTFTVTWNDPDRTVSLPGGVQVTIRDGDEVTYLVQMTDNVVSANSDGQALAVAAQITQIGGPDFGPVMGGLVGFTDSPDFQGNPVDELNISWDQSFAFCRAQFDFAPDTVSIREFNPLDFGGPSMVATVQDFFANIPAFVDATPISLGSQIVGLFFGLEGASLGPGPSVCQPDLNGDGELNFFDVMDFLDQFNGGDLSADFNNDGSLDFFDFGAFLGAFNAGCP
jgi:hypothetical protein